MIFKIAWQNIKSNRRRSISTIALNSILLALMIFFIAFQDGAHFKVFRDSIEIYSGYLQIQGEDYYAHPNYDNLIYNVKGIKDALSQKQGIKTLTSRFETFALFSGEGDSVGGMLIGIEPEAESEISRLKRSLITGNYLQKDDYGQVYLGVDLAEKLEVGLGDEIAFISSATDYSIAAAKIKVKGIFKTNLMDFDGQMAFVNMSFMEEEFLAYNTASSIVILPKNPRKLTSLVQEINTDLNHNKYTVVQWKQTLKSLVQSMKLDELMAYLTLAILVMVVFFVIMIFYVISIFLRTREIGIMKAIGTRPRQIANILITESLILTTISIVIGATIGISISAYYYYNPLVMAILDSDLYSQFGLIDNTIPTELTYYNVFGSIFTIFTINMLAIVYPLLRINSLTPIEAIEDKV